MKISPRRLVRGDITDNISVLIVGKNDVVVIGNINAVIVQNDKGFERESDLTGKRACVGQLGTDVILRIGELGIFRLRKEMEVMPRVFTAYSYDAV